MSKNCVLIVVYMFRLYMYLPFLTNLLPYVPMVPHSPTNEHIQVYALSCIPKEKRVFRWRVCTVGLLLCYTWLSAPVIKTMLYRPFT